MTSSPRWICSIRLCASRFGRRPVIWTDPLLDVGDDPPVRRRTARTNLAKPIDARSRARTTTSQAGRPMSMRCGTAHANARPTTGSPSSCRTCACAFRWAADHDDLDTARAIAVDAGFLGVWVEQYEPVELGRGTHRAAREAVDHRRLAQLYVVAAQCYATGRVDDSVRLCRSWAAGYRKRTFSTHSVRVRSCHSAVLHTPRRRARQWVELCRNVDRTRTGRLMTFASAFLADGTEFAGATDEALATVGRLTRRCRRHRQSRPARLRAPRMRPCLPLRRSPSSPTTRIAGA